MKQNRQTPTEFQERRECICDFLMALVLYNTMMHSLTGPKEHKKEMDGKKKKQDPVSEKKENATHAQRIEILD